MAGICLVIGQLAWASPGQVLHLRPCEHAHREGIVLVIKLCDGAASRLTVKQPPSWGNYMLKREATGSNEEGVDA